MIPNSIFSKTLLDSASLLVSLYPIYPPTPTWIIGANLPNITKPLLRLAVKVDNLLPATRASSAKETTPVDAAPKTSSVPATPTADNALLVSGAVCTTTCAASAMAPKMSCTTVPPSND